MIEERPSDGRDEMEESGEQEGGQHRFFKLSFDVTQDDEPQPHDGT
jgi:hypothetical protein